MTLTKKKMISEIGRRTRLKNRDVQAMLETLVEVCTEELVSGGRIEVENFLVIDVQIIDRSPNYMLRKGQFRQVTMRVSKKLKRKLNERSI